MGSRASESGRDPRKLISCKKMSRPFDAYLKDAFFCIFIFQFKCWSPFFNSSFKENTHRTCIPFFFPVCPRSASQWISCWSPSTRSTRWVIIIEFFFISSFPSYLHRSGIDPLRSIGKDLLKWVEWVNWKKEDPWHLEEGGSWYAFLNLFCMVLTSKTWSIILMLWAKTTYTPLFNVLEA